MKRKIKKFEKYSIDKFGKIYKANNDGSEKEISYKLTRGGLTVSLSNSPDSRVVKVRELMAETWFPDYKTGMFISNIDRDLYNNSVGNILVSTEHPLKFNSVTDTYNGVEIRNVNELVWVGSDGTILDYSPMDSSYTIRPIKQNAQGYIPIVLQGIPEVSVNSTVHRLVAKMFIPNPEGKEMVDHIDENKTNNEVTNLRWCTGKENTQYYHTKDGRNYYLKLIAQGKKSLVLKSAELRAEKQLVVSLSRQLKDEQAKLSKERDKFQRYITKETARLAKTKEGYDSYVNITGMKFDNVQAMVSLTGKPVQVNGKKFDSCGAAAQYIVEQELLGGTIRMKATISKELRRFVQGKRGTWDMYNLYSITV